MPNTLVDDLDELHNRIESGVLYEDYDEDTRLSGVLRQHVEALQTIQHQPFVLETGKLVPNYTIPMILHCPGCGERHIDEAEFAEKPHSCHACQHCGLVWRPAKVNTHGVRFLPGYTNA